jgi:hypothetical protein
VSILRFLNEPFPDSNDFSDNIKGALLPGVLVYIVLLFVLPADISGGHQSIYLICAYYAVITAIVCLLFNLMITHLFRFDREVPSWTLWKWVVETIVTITLIAFANILFTNYYFNVPINWPHCLNLVSMTFAVGLVPVIFIGTFKVVQKKKLYTNIAQTINSAISQQNQQAEVPSPIQEIKIQNGSSLITLDASQILFAKSLQNYVQLCYGNDGNVTVETIRKTLTNIESILSPYGIERCHRSYLVNRSKIQSITGNAQGLKLSFDGVDEIVAVSRKYVDAFRN